MVLGLAAYFQEDFERFATARVAALGSEERARAACDWINSVVGDAESSPLDHFLRGVEAEIEGRARDARASYLQASRAAPSQTLFGFNVVALEPRIVAKGIVSIFDEKVSYQGTMRLADNCWVPQPGAFEVSGGRLVTSIGGEERTAKFGGWGHVEDPSGGVVGWALMVTEGEVLERSSLRHDASKALRVRCSYEARPFDFMGFYRRIVLRGDREHGYPVIPVPDQKVASWTEPVAILGDRALLSPELFRTIPQRPLSMILSFPTLDSLIERNTALRGDWNVDEKGGVYGNTAGAECAVTTENGRLVYGSPLAIRLEVSGTMSGYVRSALAKPLPKLEQFPLEERYDDPEVEDIEEPEELLEEADH